MEWTECISKAINYIENNINEELTIEDIAKQAMISPFYFQKGFAMLCGFTVGEYIKKRRLTLAGSELVSTDRKVIDIALKYGYECVQLGLTGYNSITRSGLDGKLIYIFREGLGACSHQAKGSRTSIACENEDRKEIKIFELIYTDFSIV